MTINTNGFTIIEMMITIAVIGILSAVTFTSIAKGKPDRHLKQAATQMYLDLQMAKSTAVLNRQQVTVNFNAGNQSYSIIDQQNNVIKTVSLTSYPSGITYGSGPTSDPYGTATSFSGNTADFISYQLGASLNILRFEPNGMSNFGYVHLTNSTQSTCYALGTKTMAGNIIISKTGSGSWPIE